VKNLDRLDARSAEPYEPYTNNSIFHGLKLREKLIKGVVPWGRGLVKSTKALA
jgi:hypothetical protein